jgi:hypothetical protein
MSTGEAEADPSQRSRVWSEGELISAASAAILLVSLFALAWYGVVGRPRTAERSGLDSAVSGWRELNGVRWMILVTAVVAIAALVLHATQRSHGTATNTGLLVTALGTVAAGLLANRILIDLPSPDTVVDVKLGGFVGLLAALGIAAGGYDTLRAERSTAAPRRRQQMLPGPVTEAGRLRSETPPR